MYICSKKKVIIIFNVNSTILSRNISIHSIYTDHTDLWFIYHKMLFFVQSSNAYSVLTFFFHNGFILKQPAMPWNDCSILVVSQRILALEQNEGIIHITKSSTYLQNNRQASFQLEMKQAVVIVKKREK